MLVNSNSIRLKSRGTVVKQEKANGGHIRKQHVPEVPALELTIIDVVIKKLQARPHGWQVGILRAIEGAIEAVHSFHRRREDSRQFVLCWVCHVLVLLDVWGSLHSNLLLRSCAHSQDMLTGQHVGDNTEHW